MVVLAYYKQKKKKVERGKRQKDGETVESWSEWPCPNR